jgi:hypothetical protein
MMSGARTRLNRRVLEQSNSEIFHMRTCIFIAILLFVQSAHLSAQQRAFGLSPKEMIQELNLRPDQRQALADIILEYQADEKMRRAVLRRKLMGILSHEQRIRLIQLRRQR